MFRSVVFFLLTLTTQIGGLAFLLFIWLKKYLKWKRTYQQLALFLAFYLFCSLMVLPIVAPAFGRTPLPLYATNKQGIKPASLLACLMNRHYVKPALKEAIVAASKAMGANVTLVYLDGNFPFWNGFPLLPHKSHDDGEKLDLAFIYQSRKDQTLLNKGKGLLGYGVVEPPISGEVNQPAICEHRGYWQYSLLKRLVPQRKAPEYAFSESHNRQLLAILAKDHRIDKIFIEPHLKARLKLGVYAKIRFHGCAAVRHDDHIHIQL
jgi:hypothetical protein